jgi:transposase
MIRVPDAESEDARNLNREMRTMKKERTAHITRIRALLATQGVSIGAIDRTFKDQLASKITADGRPLGPQLIEGLHRVFDRLSLVTEQIRALQMYQAKMLRIAANEVSKVSKQVAISHQLSLLRGIGSVTSWTLSTEIFSWRDIQNRRQLAALAGLTPTPHSSGEEEREQGISKAGRGEIRSLMIEIAWGWLKLQPQSALSRWYRKRFCDGTRRNRKRGIVALARKLLVALGQYVRHGVIPEDAELVEELKCNYLPSLRPKTT